MWRCVALVAAYRQYKHKGHNDPDPTEGKLGEVFYLPEPENAVADAGGYNATMGRVGKGLPEWNFYWLDTKKQESLMADKLGFPKQLLPRLIARLYEEPDEWYWFEHEHPYSGGVKSWIADIKAGKEEPMSLLMSADPAEPVNGVLDVVASNFDDVLNKTDGDGTLFAIMSMECDACKEMVPLLEELVEKNGVRVATMDYMNNSYCEVVNFTVRPQGQHFFYGEEKQKVECMPSLLPLTLVSKYKFDDMPAIFYVPPGEPFKPVRYTHKKQKSLEQILAFYEFRVEHAKGGDEEDMIQKSLRMAEKKKREEELLKQEAKEDAEPHDEL